jgi:ketosteroid isomerase-like protein
MSRHAKTVEAIYAAFGRGDIPGILGAPREDVEWEHDAPITAFRGWRRARVGRK